MTHYDLIVIICGIAHDNLHMRTTGKQNKNMNSRPTKWQKSIPFEDFQSANSEKVQHIFVYLATRSSDSGP